MHRIISIFFLLSALQLSAQQELVYQDAEGVIRWTKDKSEVALFGANYCLPSACDYRAAGYVTDDRKKLVDQDMVHFARMGWDGLRFSFWGDFENSDYKGNLLSNEHLDLMDYLLYKAKERGIYMLLSPIVTYDSKWPDAMDDTTSVSGFSKYYIKGELGFNPPAIEAQQNYIRQLLEHVNPYTGLAYKNEPNILFIEMINEPAHHSDDEAGSILYINALVEAVRSTGCQKLVFHNISQDFNMATALQKSDIQGVSFGWYPSGLNSGHMLQGNYLPMADAYPQMLNPFIAKKSRIVYEFDSPDLLNSTMYPAMARTFRSVGAQYAAMFSYDMLSTAPFNLGWQTHYLNLVYTPQKALGAIIAGEIMRREPMYKKYSPYPADTSFGNFHLNFEKNLAELVANDKFIYSNHTNSSPANTAALQQIVGYGSSPIVRYDGKGIYFLNKLKAGTWRLEVYPDALPVDDPFKMPSPGKIVTRTISRDWEMQVHLPDLGADFYISAINANNDYKTIAKNEAFTIRPGVYILTTDKKTDLAALPSKIGHIGTNEFVVLPDQALPLQLHLDYHHEYIAGKPIMISADIYGSNDPESVALFIKKLGNHWFEQFPMTKTRGYTWQVMLPEYLQKESFIEYCIVASQAGKKINFPSGIGISPGDWNYYGSENWHSSIVSAASPITLLNPAQDIESLSFTRYGDGGRNGVFEVLPSRVKNNMVYRFFMPLKYDSSLTDYTVSVPVGEKIADRKRLPENAGYLMISARGVSQKQVFFIKIVEQDGTTWSAQLNPGADWTDIKIPLSDLKPDKGAMLPLGYPGRWNYWMGKPEGRGKPGDNVHVENIERLQISVQPSADKNIDADKDSWIEISEVSLFFEY